MNQSFVRVDDALIDRVFQPSVDWLGRHTSFDGLRVARLCVDLAAFAWILSRAGGMTGSAHPSLMAARFAILVVGLGAISVLRGLFQRTSAGARLGANPLRAGMHVHRAACLVWLAGLMAKTAGSPVGLESLALLAVGLFATAAVYAGACSNCPPKRRERRDAGLAWKPVAVRRG